VELKMNTTVRIRPFRLDDLDAVYSAVIASRSELSPWMPWCHEEYSRAETAEWIEGRPTAWTRNEEWSFLIVGENDTVLGGCGIHRLDLKNGVGELGYWVRTPSTRQGIATEATRQLCRWAFSEARLRRIEILASVENLRSQRVAEKAGGVREGILRHRIWLHERPHDCILYSILKGEN
jgi:ribosomal-protein-serine acetyltransferase